MLCIRMFTPMFITVPYTFLKVLKIILYGLFIHVVQMQTTIFYFRIPTFRQTFEAFVFQVCIIILLGRIIDFDHMSRLKSEICIDRRDART